MVGLRFTGGKWSHGICRWCNLKLNHAATWSATYVGPLLNLFGKRDTVKVRKWRQKWDQDDVRCDADATCDPGQHQRVPGCDHRVRLQDIFRNSSPQVAAQTKVSTDPPLSIDIGEKKRIFWTQQSHFLERWHWEQRFGNASCWDRGSTVWSSLVLGCTWTACHVPAGTRATPDWLK